MQISLCVRIRIQDCQAGSEALHKTVYELCDLPVKGSHENSAYIYIWPWLCYIQNTFSKKWLWEQNKSPSKFCVHCKMCFDIEVYDENTFANLLFKQPYHFHYRKCITMNADMCFFYTR